MKTETKPDVFYPKSVKKIFLTMKITLLLVIVSVGNMFAANIFSQSLKMTVDMHDVTVREVISEVEKQGGISFLFNDNLPNLNNFVSVSYVDHPLKDVLDHALYQADMTYETINEDFVMLLSKSNYAEEGVITGRVTESSSGLPLPGVTIMIRGTTTGTVTDVDGFYTISDVLPTNVLVFSYVGMRTQEIEVGSLTEINIELENEALLLDEVVAIGYGTARKSDITGSVSSVSGDLVTERRTTQLSQALQGSMPGVTVTRNNNAPGSSATIRVRGITTIGDSNPLIIVDGVPVNNINWVNPSDVESISVLKDAASASIYGSRAAAGVILITTKRAETGQLNFEFTTEYGFETPTTMPEYVNVTRYMEMKNELRWNDNGNDANEFPRFPSDLVNNYMSLNADNPDLYPNTDWVDLILSDYAPRQSHNLRVSAGTDAIRSTFSLTYDKTDALYMDRTYERLSTRFNNDVTINNFLSATLDMHYRRSISKQPSMNPIYSMLISAPIYAAEWSDGRVAGGKDGHNMYGQIKYGGSQSNWWNQVGGKLSLDLTPLEGLKFSAVVAPNLNFDKAKNHQLRVPYTAWDDPTRVQGTLQWANSTDLYENRNDNHQVTTQFLANYAKGFEGHNINLLGGYENYYAYYESLGASRQQYELTSFPYLNLGPLTYRGNSGSAYENAYRSWFGRAMYNYMNRYFFQANIRYDASSRFHEDYRWGAFPSLSAGWVVSEEAFMQDIPVLSFLKMRGSWGSLGNERIGNYPYQATIGFSNALFHQGSNVVAAQSAAQWQYAIHNITWETTETFGVGLDLGFFDNRLSLIADYYQKTTSDMLLALEIPNYIGYDNPDQNTGNMYTKGWELEAIYNNRAGEFNYSFSLNISDYKTKMGDLGGTEFIGAQIVREGSEFQEWYGYLSDGLFQSQEEVDNSPVTSGSVRPGDIKYRDISGPDEDPDGVISGAYDRVLLGGSLPRYLYGANLRLGYKGFDFGLVIQGVGKQNNRLSGLMVEPIPENWGHIPKILDGTYWSVYNTEQQNLDAQYPRLSRVSMGNNYAMSDFWLINGAYLRLKNISIGYTLPRSWAQRVSMQNLRLYATATDIYTFNHYPKGWDPEVSSTGYPITTSIIFGVSVNF